MSRILTSREDIRQWVEARAGNPLLAEFPDGTRLARPLGGYFLWLELPRQVDALVLHQLALEHGISIAPGPIFSPTQRFRNCIRLNYGSPWTEASEKAMETLGRIVRSF